MKDGQYYIEYSRAKMGWCVYKNIRNSATRGPKEAGPFRDKEDAKVERSRLNRLNGGKKPA